MFGGRLYQWARHQHECLDTSAGGLGPKRCCRRMACRNVASPATAKWDVLSSCIAVSFRAASLKKMAKYGWQSYPEEQRSSWVLKQPAQLVIAISQVGRVHVPCILFQHLTSTCALTHAALGMRERVVCSFARVSPQPPCS